MAAPNENRRAMSSLLSLQPQNSGMIWDQMMGGNTILMPVSQPESNIDAEADSFVGQSSSTPPLVSFQNNPGGPAALSQLQQPLRPSQPKPTPTPPPPAPGLYQTQQTTTTFQPVDRPQASPSPLTSGNSQTQTIYAEQSYLPPAGTNYGIHGDPVATANQTLVGGPPVGTAVGPPGGMTSGPPPMGPSQSFRRQGPLQHHYAPTPGLTHPRSVPDPTPPPPYLPPYQAPTYQPPAYQPPAYQPAHSPLASGNYQQAQQQQIPQPSGLPGGAMNSIPAEQPTILLGSNENYQSVQCHWFYCKEVEKKRIWLPFSLVDSLALEEAFKRGDNNAVVTTDGGRYDVKIGERLRQAVYWEEDATPVKRSSWFFKADGQNRFVPYDEDLADRIEEHYRDAVVNHKLHHRLELPSHECIVVHNAQLVAHYQPSKHTDEWGTVVDGQMRTRVVKRGINEILKVEEGETSRIDHLVFLVHGVGGVCDLKFRSLVECVDDFRSMSLSLMKTHFKSAIDEGRAGRVEFLPVSWHAKLHGDATGIDKRMQTITLQSIPKLRHFTNDTLMDIFFYTSPVYCQTIVDTVGSEINRLYQTFLQRNTGFSGRISLVGHSLGSLIIFDILAHQMGPEPICSPLQEPVPVDQTEPAQTETEPEPVIPDTLEAVFQILNLEEYISKFQEEKLDLATLKLCTDGELKDLGLPMGSRKKLTTYLKNLDEELQKAQMKKESELTATLPGSLDIPSSDSRMSLLNRQESVTSVNYMVGVAGTGQPSVVYPKLAFNPSSLFALGSPIAMFLTIRGIQTIGEEYHLPTCPAFFNIFHPAYRIETLIEPQAVSKPVLVPHHKGRKRMHLELRDSLARMGTDLKQRLMDSIRNTWHSLSEFARAHKPEQLEAEVDRVVNEELIAHQRDNEDTESTVSGADFASQEDVQIGQLNGGRRIDYVLQEKPIESFNEYLFALASHACYWESEDTALMILKEIYHLDGVLPQSPNVQKLAQHGAGHDSISRGDTPLNTSSDHSFIFPPNASTNSPQNLSAPPLQGFVRASPIVHR